MLCGMCLLATEPAGRHNLYPVSTCEPVWSGPAIDHDVRGIGEFWPSRLGTHLKCVYSIKYKYCTVLKGKLIALSRLFYIFFDQRFPDLSHISDNFTLF